MDELWGPLGTLATLIQQNNVQSISGNFKRFAPFSCLNRDFVHLGQAAVDVVKDNCGSVLAFRVEADRFLSYIRLQDISLAIVRSWKTLAGSPAFNDATGLLPLLAGPMLGIVQFISTQEKKFACNLGQRYFSPVAKVVEPSIKCWAQLEYVLSRIYEHAISASGLTPRAILRRVLRLPKECLQ